MLSSWESPCRLSSSSQHSFEVVSWRFRLITTHIASEFFSPCLSQLGVVKYIANGLSVRSTIERPPKAADWLDQNGELIQILVLQNYLFFGNASSILAYIASMFEDPGPDIDPIFVPPIPKVIILDLTLLTGMDTSSVDVFGEILTLCRTNDCKLFMAGVNRGLMKTMSLSGFKPDSAKVRSTRKLRFFADLDMAVGKAEDSKYGISFKYWRIRRTSISSTRGYPNNSHYLCLLLSALAARRFRRPNDSWMFPRDSWF